MEYLSSIVFHTVILKISENGQKLVNHASFLYRRKKNGVSIIDSIPHCHTENALKKGQKQEMWLHFYIVGKRSIYHR